MFPSRGLYLLLAIAWPGAFGTLHYGRCPRFAPSEYSDQTMEQFEQDRGEVMYFSNIRFERLFGHPPAIEKYVSGHMIQLRYSNESGENCFHPFQLVRKAENESASSTRRRAITLINTQVISVSNNDHLLAFSCVEDGNRKLEYLWVIRRREADWLSLSRVQQTFGTELDRTATKAAGLMKSHYQLPFCSKRMWPALVASLGAIAVAIAVVAALIFWIRSKRMMVLKSDANNAECIDGEASSKRIDVEPI